MAIKKVVAVLMGAAAVAVLYFFCESQTQGFRYYYLLSNLPNDPRWELPPLASEEQEKVDHLLDQSFTYLGSGGWCFAFLGADGKTVLKFYKHTHLHPLNLFKDFSFKKLFLDSSPWNAEKPYFQEFNFKSCTLMYKEAKERTGLLYAHLNKTNGKHKPTTLIDPSGVRHTIDLDKTEFVVQRKAELLIPHLETLLKSKNQEEAEHCLDDLLECLLFFYKKGIRDYDKSIRKNFGFIDGHAVSLDLSSFGPDDSLKDPLKHQREILLKTHRVSRWLKKHHPQLHQHYEKRIYELFSMQDAQK